MVVVNAEGPPVLCKTDQVGEICVTSGSTGTTYYGLDGMTNATFKVSRFIQFVCLGTMTATLPITACVLINFRGDFADAPGEIGRSVVLRIEFLNASPSPSRQTVWWVCNWI